MSLLNIPATENCDFDCLALGEVMLRFDPGVHKIRRSDQFRVCEGGAEYNVIQGLSSCFEQRTAIISALADNDVGHLIESLIHRSGVDSRWLRWVSHDGVGHKVRNGLYFMERGFGERGAKAVMDRGHTAIAQLQPETIDWSTLFAEARPRWFHVGGVMAGLSEQSPSVVMAAMKAARQQGVIVSYDLNYRDSLWRSRGGRAAAAACDELLLPYADVLFGVHELSRTVDSLDTEVFSDALKGMQQRFPNLKLAVTTMRVVTDASHNDWGGMCLAGGEIIEARPRHRLPIYDRVGGGDAFAAGFIHGLLAGESLKQCIELAVAHGALVMSTPGDNSMASREEVEACAASSDASANR